MGKQTLASRDTELRPQRGHNVHLTLVIDQKYLLSAAFDPAHRIPVHRPVARARLWRVLAPHQTIGAVLHSVEATVTVVVHITVKQVSVVAVLLCHAELCHASFPVAAVLRLALIVQATSLDQLLLAAAVHLVLPVALAFLLVEHEAVAAPLRVVGGRLTLMEYIAVHRVRVVAVRLRLAKVLLDSLPHVVRLAEALHINCPVALLFGCVVAQIVLAREDYVLAVLAHKIAVAVHVVRVLAVHFVRAERGRRVPDVVLQEIAGGTLGCIAPVAVLLRLVPD